jgi:hypothetical protein
MILFCSAHIRLSWLFVSEKCSAPSLEIAEEPASGPSAIDAQRLTGDICTLGGGEEKYGMGNFLHGARPTEWDVTEHSMGAFLICCVS